MPRFDIYMPFRSGEDVSTKVDPRHVGKVVAVFASHTVRVRWEIGDVIAKTDHHYTELERAEQ